MSPTKTDVELARGDARLAKEVATRGLTFVRWLRRNDASHVAVVRDEGGPLVLKAGHSVNISREFNATRSLEHPAFLLPHTHLEGSQFDALLMPFAPGVPIVEAARSNIDARQNGLRKNLPMAFGYVLNDLGENTFVHCGDSAERLLRTWLRCLADALSSLHEQRHLHLDIAPDNILVHEDRCVLLDFGLSQHFDEVREGALIGSAAYLAPELGLGRLSPAADWYSLGVVVFQALSGGLPFEGGGPEVLVRKQSMSPPRVSELCPEVSPDLDALCAAWLMRDPVSRGDASAVHALDPAD